MLPSIAYTLFGLLMLGSGAVWWHVLARQRAGVSPLPFRDRLEPVWNPLVVLVALAWIVFQVSAQVTTSTRSEEPVPELTLRLVQSACALSVLVMVIMLALLTQAGRSRFRDFGIELSHWKQDLIVGGLGFLASLLPVYLVLLISSPLRSPETTHSFFKVMQDHPGWESVAWVSLAVVILAPLSEEIVFRVILQGWLETRIAPDRAVGIVAVVFAAVHGLPDSLALVPLALILGYVYHRRRSYLAVVVLHALFNAWNLVYYFLVGLPESTTDSAVVLGR